MPKMTTTTVLGFAVAAFAAAAPADLITPSNCVASKVFKYSTYPLQTCTNLINNAGLSGPPYNELSTHGNSADNTWGCSAVSWDLSGEWVAFDLGANYDLTNAWIWNFNQAAGTYRGIKTFDIYVSTNMAGAYTRVGTSSFSLTQAGGGDEPAQNVAFSAQGVRRVQFRGIENFSLDGYNLLGLSEVKFGGTRAAAQSTERLFKPVAAADLQGHWSDLDGSKLIDGSGYFMSYYTGSGGYSWRIPDETMAADCRHNVTQGSDIWLSNTLISNAAVVFDLGTNVDLSAGLIWNYNQTGWTPRSIRSMNVSVSGVGTNGPFTPVTGSPFTLAQATGWQEEPAQRVSFSAANVRAVKFTVNSNWGDPDGVGLSEVRFAGRLHVPPKPNGTLVSIW